jgi:hypothetical protein
MEEIEECRARRMGEAQIMGEEDGNLKGQDEGGEREGEGERGGGEGGREGGEREGEKWFLWTWRAQREGKKLQPKRSWFCRTAQENVRKPHQKIRQA